MASCCRFTILVGLVAVGTAASASAVTVSPVTYTTKVFMPGMQVTVPDAGWRIHQDHKGQFTVGPSNGPTIHFWLDPIASTPKTDTPVAGVGRTAAALIAWLRHNPNFVVSSPVTRTIGAGLKMTSVDLDVSPNAPQVDPSCPGPCLDYFIFKGEDPFGTGRGEPVRLYVAPLGGHTLLIAIDVPSKGALKSAIQSSTHVLGSVRLS